MPIAPKVLRKLLTENPFGSVITTALLMNDAEVAELMESVEKVLGKAFRRLLQDENCRQEYILAEEQMFPTTQFTATGPLAKYLNELLALLRTVDFHGEHTELTDVPIQVRIIENPRCAFCGILPWGTLLIGRALIRELDHSELVAVLLHEVEHFETFDHTLLLAYLPSLLHLIEENQAPGIKRIIHSLQTFASHRSIILERTADNGSLSGKTGISSLTVMQQPRFKKANMIQPSDFGPIYTETLLGRFPVEPWNTFSNLIFLLVFARFFREIQQQPRRYPITFISLMILLVGFFGGTVYHATRSHNIWLILDFVPIGVLVLLGTLFFWRKLTGSLLKSLLLLVVTLGASRLVAYWLITERQVRISFGYVMMAVAILLPAFLLSRKFRWKGRGTLVKAVISFSGAVLCRIGDSSWGKVLPMGTHFIWHILGGIATYYLFSFLLMVEGSEGEEGKVA